MAARLTKISNFKSFTSLRTIYLDWNSLTDIPTSEFPSLLDRLGVSGNLFTNIDMSNLTGLTTLYCQQNPQLNTIDLSANIPLVYIDLHNNEFTSDLVNSILIQLDSNGLSGGNCSVSQVPSAPPTGDGIIAKNNLISKGWSVTTN